MTSPRTLLASLAVAVATLLPGAADANPTGQVHFQPPTPPGGYLAPVDLKVAPPANPDPATRPTDWVTVAAVAGDEAKRADLYAKLNALAGGRVHIVFRDGASVQVELEGCATTGVVTKNAADQRVIYDYATVEWVRAAP